MPEHSLRLYTALALSCLIAACASPSHPEAEAPQRATFLCGEQTVDARFSGEHLHLQIGDKTLALQQAVSASGARYQRAETPTAEFWNKGNRAMLTVDGKAYPECVATSDTLSTPITKAPPALRVLTLTDLQGAEWVVEDVGGNGIIDNSRVTLNFGTDGQIHGRASCNSYRGYYTLAAPKLSVSTLVGTMMACAPALMDQEDKFLALLKYIQSVEIDDTGALILVSENKQRILARRE